MIRGKQHTLISVPCGDLGRIKRNNSSSICINATYKYCINCVYVYTMQRNPTEKWGVLQLWINDINQQSRNFMSCGWPLIPPPSVTISYFPSLHPLHMLLFSLLPTPQPTYPYMLLVFSFSCFPPLATSTQLCSAGCQAGPSSKLGSMQVLVEDLIISLYPVSHTVSISVLLTTLASSPFFPSFMPSHSPPTYLLSNPQTSAILMISLIPCLSL